MKVILELPQITCDVLERWAWSNGLRLDDHLTELVREDVRTIVKSISPPEFDVLFGLNLVDVAVASELEGVEIGRYAPFLETFEFEQERISIWDNKLGRLAEVSFKNDSWFCDVEKQDNCVHIGFALALLKVREARLSHRAPK